MVEPGNDTWDSPFLPPDAHPACLTEKKNSMRPVLGHSFINFAIPGSQWKTRKFLSFPFSPLKSGFRDLHSDISLLFPGLYVLNHPPGLLPVIFFPALGLVLVVKPA